MKAQKTHNGALVTAQPESALPTKEHNSKRRQFLMGGAALSMTGLLSACGGGILNQGPPPRFFKLSPKSTFPEDLPNVDWQLLIDTPTSDASLDTTRVALTRQLHEIEYFARSNWIDTVPGMVQTLIVESFENSGRIVGVGRGSVGLRAEFLMMVEVREFQISYLDGGAPEAHVAMICKLVRMPRRVIVSNWRGETLVTAERNSIEAITVAFDTALGKVMKDLVAWALVAGEEAIREEKNQPSA
ncbi:ABC-type transport auxiliary lipoprotein family protein [Rhodovibrionaceae bacterium A322]